MSNIIYTKDAVEHFRQENEELTRCVELQAKTMHSMMRGLEDLYKENKALKKKLEAALQAAKVRYEQEKQCIEEESSVLDMPIMEIPCSRRGALRKVARVVLGYGDNNTTVGHLIKLTRRDLMKIPNFGQVSLMAVEDALHRLGLSLKSEES